MCICHTIIVGYILLADKAEVTIHLADEAAEGKGIVYLCLFEVIADAILFFC